MQLYRQYKVCLVFKQVYWTLIRNYVEFVTYFRHKCYKIEPISLFIRLMGYIPTPSIHWVSVNMDIVRVVVLDYSIA